MKKRALVAGGAGFIGSHLCDLLIEKNYSVIVFDNFITGSKDNVQHLLGKVEIFPADIEDESSVKSCCEGPIDEIYNLASPASPIDFSKIPIKILLTSAIGQKNLLNLAKEKRAKILFASTSEVYGDPLMHPQGEEYFGNVNPIGERSCYDEAKRFGEALTMAYHKKEGIDSRIVRIFNTYGPRMRLNDGRIIPNFFLQAMKREPLTVYGDGTQTRSFCYVTDLVDGIYRLMQSDYPYPVNMGNSDERSVLQMAKIINQLTGNSASIKHLPLPENDPKQRQPALQRAKEILNWQPSTLLDVGLNLTYKYFLSKYN